MGAVFHLGLQASDLQGASIALVPGDPGRVERLAAIAGAPTALASTREFTSFLARIETDGPPIPVEHTTTEVPPVEPR